MTSSNPAPSGLDHDIAPKDARTLSLRRGRRRTEFVVACNAVELSVNIP
jgi:hypothetical protein